MLEGVKNVAWQDLAQPSWNRTGEPGAALQALEAVETEEQAQDAYNRLLYAVGNNHAGTYYPALLQVLPFLRELLDHPRARVRETVLDILIDVAFSFEPEPEFAEVGGQSLRGLVHAALQQMRSRVAECAGSANSARETELAGELLEGIAAEDT